MDQHSLDCFRNRSVFVTGHTGFKGSWLAIWLDMLGAEISGYSLAAPTSPSNYEASNVRELLTAHYEADLRDLPALRSALERTSPTVIFHLAAQSLVGEGYTHPRDTFESNVMGTVNLLEGVRQLGLPCTIVVVTSDKCYENREQLWSYRECDALGGRDPYSASKGAAEVVVAAYRQSFFDASRIARHGVKLATARAGNVIGGGDWSKDRIVTDIMGALHAREPIPVRNPEAVRPWQHLTQPLSGYLHLAARMLQSNDPKWCTAWNFGPCTDDEVSVRELVELFCRAWGGGRWKDMSNPDAPHEARTLRLSIEKARLELGWKPYWHLPDTVERTVAWYRQYLEGAPQGMRRACQEDIVAYEKASAGILP